MKSNTFQKYDRIGDHARGNAPNIDENCKTIQIFKMYSKQLDSKYDKYERLVKMSRDITIESKRIIFLLHTIDRENKEKSVLNEAEKRLESLLANNFKSLAAELDDEDPYMYHRAFSPGIQEFMEAYMYYNFLKDKRLFSWDHYQKKFEQKVQDENEKEICAFLPVTDYLLGLLDVTGELMRKCINNVASGHVTSCFETCSLVRNLYTGFLSVAFFKYRELSRKMLVLKQSLLKMEMVCYNIQVRGNEMQKHMLTDIDEYQTFVNEGTE